MQKLMKAMHKNEKGFTLVELMVVVVIIGILVAIAIPIYGAVQRNAQERACHANMRTIDGQAMVFRAMSGDERPASFAEMFDGGVPTCPTDEATYTIMTDANIIDPAVDYVRATCGNHDPY